MRCMPDAQRQSLITVMFITCRRPRRLRSRMSPALLDPGGCPSVLGSYRRACSSIRSGIGGSAPRARLLHALAWPRVTGRLSSEVRPGVRVSGSRVRHVTTRDTSHGPSRRHVGRWVMLKLMRVRGRGRPGTSYMSHVRCVACIAHGFNYSQECGCELGDIHRASTRTRYSKTHSIPPIERVAHVSSSRLRASGKAVGRTSCFA